MSQRKNPRTCPIPSLENLQIAISHHSRTHMYGHATLTNIIPPAPNTSHTRHATKGNSISMTKSPKTIPQVYLDPIPTKIYPLSAPPSPSPVQYIHVNTIHQYKLEFTQRKILENKDVLKIQEAVTHVQTKGFSIPGFPCLISMAGDLLSCGGC